MMLDTSRAGRWENQLRSAFERNYHILVAMLLYLPMIFLGYGEEPDSYIIAGAGENFLRTGSYVPSRRPGAFAYEAPEAILNRLGGSVLSNLASLAASFAVLASFTWLLKRLEVPQRHRIIWVLILLPIFWNNSAVTQDYMWALALCFLGAVLILKTHDLSGAVLWGLAIGSRATSVAVIAGFALFFLMSRSLSSRRIAVVAVVTIAIGAACFVPSYTSSNNSFGFLNAANWGRAALWTPYLRIGRFVYKNIYVWGLPAFLVLCAAVGISIRNFRELLADQWRTLVLASTFVIIAHEGIFLEYPMKPEYLLPMIPFLLVIVAIGLRSRPRVLDALIVSTALYTVFSLNIARPDVPWRATAAIFGVFPERGRLAQVISDRLKNRECSNIECVARVNADLIRRIQLREGPGSILY